MSITPIKINFPKNWTKVVNIEATETYDRILCEDGSYFTVDLNFVSVGDTVRVVRGRVYVQLSLSLD